MDRVIEDKSLIKKKYWKYIMIAILAICLLSYLIFRDNSSKLNVQKDRLVIGECIKDNFDDFIRIMGRVEPISTVFLDVEEGGKVEEIFLEEGSMVRKGDVILKLANSNLNLSIMNSESNLAYHTNELRNTMIEMEQQKISNKQQLLKKDYEIGRLKRDYDYKKSLYEQELISKEEYILAREDYELASKDRKLIHMKLVQDSIFRNNQRKQMDYNLSNMQVNLKMVRERLENLNVKAPIDGQLGLLNAEIGESINKGQRIGQINVLTSYKIKAKISEHYIDRVNKGLFAYMERQNHKYELKIDKVYPEVRNGQFEIDLIFTGELPANMRTGLTFYMNLQLGETKKSLQIPRGGFFQSTGGQWVYVLSEDESYATKRNISIGKQNPKYYELLEGLVEGEKIICSGYENFGDNEKLILK
ncbi:MAG: HlyD family efflux transporter periplasmic adaptor subunit [Marinifilaceae bacterium]|jgi:HlyD family secretion protein|nr:HlyD family efflux transporter periplasmic adaptor subunit [Marinifilaceae bacterium]